MDPFRDPYLQPDDQPASSSSNAPLAPVPEAEEPVPILVIAISGSPCSGKSTLAITTLMIIINSLRQSRPRFFERTLLFQDAHMAFPHTASYHESPMARFEPRIPEDNHIVQTNHSVQNHHSFHQSTYNIQFPPGTIIETPDRDRLEGLDIPFLYHNITHDNSHTYRDLRWKEGALERGQEARRIHNFLNLPPSEILMEPGNAEPSVNMKAKDYFEKAILMAIIEGCRLQGTRHRDAQGKRRSLISWAINNDGKCVPIVDCHIKVVVGDRIFAEDSTGLHSVSGRELPNQLKNIRKHIDIGLFLPLDDADEAYRRRSRRTPYTPENIVGQVWRTAGYWHDVVW